MSFCRYRSLFWFILFLGVLCFLLSIWTLKSFTYWPGKLAPLRALMKFPIVFDALEDNVTDSEEESVSYNVITISDDLSAPDDSIQDVTETLLGDLRAADSFLSDLKDDESLSDDGQDTETPDDGQDANAPNDIHRAGSSHGGDGSVAESLPNDFKVTHSLYGDRQVKQLLSGDSKRTESLPVDGKVIESMRDSSLAKEKNFYNRKAVNSLLGNEQTSQPVTDKVEVTESLLNDVRFLGYKLDGVESVGGQAVDSLPYDSLPTDYVVKATETTPIDLIPVKSVHRDVTRSIQGEGRDGRVNNTVKGRMSEVTDEVKNPPGSLEKQLLRKDLNITKLLKDINDAECLKVVNNPGSYWRSQPVQEGDALFTAQRDGERMAQAIRCGIMDDEYLTTPPVPELYPFEKFYLSHPPLVDVMRATSEKHSSVTFLGPSKLALSETIRLRVDVSDARGVPKGFGGDEVRVWFTDTRLDHTAVTAKVKDLGNGSYIATAQAPWVGTYRVNAAVTYSREYLRALAYLQLTMKTFRHVGALFENKQASELTACYHIQLIPGHSKSDLCNMSAINGSPWFCARPTKNQLDCHKDFAGSRVIADARTIPATPSEIELFRRSSGAESKIFRLISNNIKLDVVTDSLSNMYMSPEPACNKIPISDTWNFKMTTGFMYKNIWHPTYCHIPRVSRDSVYSNLEVIILGDSNGRSHYYQFLHESGCSEVKKAMTKKWHKPLLCVHKKNGFTLRWEPHSQPFMNGVEIAEKGSLAASSVEIDKIPATGRYLVILNHFFHLTTAHISSIHYKFRAIKDSLVRLLKRNPQVLVVLQGPHTAQVGWPNHYEAGDMLGHEIMRIQKEIFKEIRDKVIFLNTWDMTVATANMDFHPSTGGQTFATLVGYISGR